MLAIKRVLLDAGLQQQVGQIFALQEGQFLEGIDSEVPFTGDWKPDPDELLTVQGLADTNALANAMNQNALALPVLDAANFESEGIKGLVAVVGQGQNKRALIQLFWPHQILSRQFSLLFSGGVFRKLEEPGFSLDNKLVGLLDSHGVLKFKAYHLIRRIFDVAAVYRDATDAELTTFCGMACLSVPDPDEFVATADEKIRKLVHSVEQTGVLQTYTVAQIRRKATAIGFQISVAQGKFVVPADKKARKEFLSFLLNKVYKGPIDQRLQITNSNRPL